MDEPDIDIYNWKKLINFMKKFEIMTLTKGTLGESKAKDFSKSLDELVSQLGGKIENKDYWGKRKLAYAIRKETDGFYEVTLFEIPEDKITNLKTKLNMESNLVRYLITASS
ncbi:30S ribosomal protein S6 [Patescibacteria group bacterium]